MIKPTVGRVVWFRPGHWDSSNVARFDSAQPLAAIVTYVWSDRMVSLIVFDQNGINHARSSVPLIQEGDPRPPEFFCEWMPYQKGQAAKTEALLAATSQSTAVDPGAAA